MKVRLFFFSLLRPTSAKDIVEEQGTRNLDG